MKHQAVRTRIAPSPTGIAHIGTAYMALFNYAYAKKHGGEFFVRIEDTDRKRFVDGAEEVIYQALDWLEIPYTFSFRQSERLDVYKEAAKTLVEKGHAYYCFCSSQELEEMRQVAQSKKEIPRYDRRCLKLSPQEIDTKLARGESYVLRLKMPENEVIGWEDQIRGRVEINTKELDDQVILKSDGFPTYHLAVVIDDHEMEISHVIRGEEWISSTPKHILLYRYFGWDAPEFAHMPLLRNPDKSKMSKRKNDVSIPSYKEKGYLPEALANYLCLLGWSHPEGKDIFSREEFINAFSMDRMVKNGPIFDLAKLNWMNGKYIREHISHENLVHQLEPFLPKGFPKSLLSQVLPLVKERLTTLKDIGPLTDFFYQKITVKKADLIPKKQTIEQVKEYLETSLKLLVGFSVWEASQMEVVLRDACDAKTWNRGAFFMSLRVAVTGKSVTPPLFETIQILGKDITMLRIKEAISLLE